MHKKLNIESQLRKAKSALKRGATSEATERYQSILLHFPNNLKARRALEQLQYKSASEMAELEASIVQLLQNGHFAAAKNILLKKRSQGVDNHIISNLLGCTFQGLGQFRDAQRAYAEAAKWEPTFAPSYSNQASALNAEGRFDEAMPLIDKALSLQPNFAEAHNQRGVALKALGQLEASLESFKLAKQLSPRNSDILNNLGNALLANLEFEASRDVFLETTACSPTSWVGYHNLGVAYSSLNENEAAQAAYEAAIKLDPMAATAAHLNLASLFADMGREVDAVESLENLLKWQPNSAVAHRHLTELKKYAISDSHTDLVEKLQMATDLTWFERSQLHYARAKMFEDTSQYAEAFEQFTLGAAARLKDTAYDSALDRRRFNAASKLPDLLPISRCSGGLNESSPRPIFIVGMPRSGTTLLESVLSSHDQVAAGGEMDHVLLYADRFLSGQHEISPEPILELHDRYLDAIKKVARDKRFVVDKQPRNFMAVPLILNTFSDAKVIHIRRDPGATCWSNFKTFFLDPSLSYSFSIQGLVDYYQQYVDLMAQFHDLYGERLINIQYEDLTDKADTVIPALLDNLGLNFQEACLHPERNHRRVQTASRTQVTRQIYSGSSDVWRAYEPYLNGAFDKLY